MNNNESQVLIYQKSVNGRKVIYLIYCPIGFIKSWTGFLIRKKLHPVPYASRKMSDPEIKRQISEGNPTFCVYHDINSLIRDERKFTEDKEYLIKLEKLKF